MPFQRKKNYLQSQPSPSNRRIVGSSRAKGMVSGLEDAKNDSYMDVLLSLKEISRQYQDDIRNISGKIVLNRESKSIEAEDVSMDKSPQQQPLSEDIMHSVEEVHSSSLNDATSEVEASSSPMQESLYFSEVLNNFDKPENKKDVVKDILKTDTSSVIQRMQLQMEVEKIKLQIASSEKDIADRISHLRMVEESWKALKIETDQKLVSLFELEESIKHEAATIKNMLKKKMSLEKSYKEIISNRSKSKNF